MTTTYASKTFIKIQYIFSNKQKLLYTSVINGNRWDREGWMKLWKEQYLLPNSNDPQGNKRGHYTPPPPQHPTRPWEKYHLQKNNFIHPNPPTPYIWTNPNKTSAFPKRTWVESKKHSPRFIHFCIPISPEISRVGYHPPTNPLMIYVPLHTTFLPLRIVNCPWRRNRAP